VIFVRRRVDAASDESRWSRVNIELVQFGEHSKSARPICNVARESLGDRVYMPVVYVQKSVANLVVSSFPTLL
jgi:hypothetical protein